MPLSTETASVEEVDVSMSNDAAEDVEVEADKVEEDMDK